MQGYRSIAALMAVLATGLASGSAQAQTAAPGAAVSAAAPVAAATDGVAVAKPAPAAPAKRLVAAKQLFGSAKTPAPLAARAIGSYSRGCLAGARPLATDGPAWQAMRLSRNRVWGHPALISMIEKLADDSQLLDGWPGLLVGDMSQPRGGPMITGHASHQIGLDADIWLMPMPNKKLSRQEREELSAVSMLAADEMSVNPKIFTEDTIRLLRRAASYDEVERVLVHPAIKKAMCASTMTDQQRGWLRKIRPFWGHFDHFHVRLGCPKGTEGCVAQAPTPGDDGCGKELDDWFVLLARAKRPAPPPDPNAKPAPPPKPITLDQLPAECRVVLGARAATAATTGQ